MPAIEISSFTVSFKNDSDADLHNLRFPKEGTVNANGKEISNNGLIDSLMAFPFKAAVRNVSYKGSLPPNKTITEIHYINKNGNDTFLPIKLEGSKGMQFVVNGDISVLVPCLPAKSEFSVSFEVVSNNR